MAIIGEFTLPQCASMLTFLLLFLGGCWPGNRPFAVGVASPLSDARYYSVSGKNLLLQTTVTGGESARKALCNKWLRAAVLLGVPIGILRGVECNFIDSPMILPGEAHGWQLFPERTGYLINILGYVAVTLWVEARAMILHLRHTFPQYLVLLSLL